MSIQSSSIGPILDALPTLYTEKIINLSKRY